MEYEGVFCILIYFHCTIYWSTLYYYYFSMEYVNTGFSFPLSLLAAQSIYCFSAVVALFIIQLKERSKKSYKCKNIIMNAHSIETVSFSFASTNVSKRSAAQQTAISIVHTKLFVNKLFVCKKKIICFSAMRTAALIVYPYDMVWHGTMHIF